MKQLIFRERKENEYVKEQYQTNHDLKIMGPNPVRKIYK